MNDIDKKVTDSTLLRGNVSDIRFYLNWRCNDKAR